MDLSPDARAILLLTTPFPEDGPDGPRPLARAEYGRLARRLLAHRARPEDLLGPAADELQGRLDADRDPRVDRPRLERLLDRGGDLDRALGRWRGQAIGVATRADADYPQRLKQRLGHASPAVLFHCGNPALLHAGGLAVVGSRRAADDVLGYARHIGTLAAGAACPIVSGAARGVDRTAMDGALHRGGPAAGILPHGLAGSWWLRSPAYRAALAAGNLCLCSAYAPEAGWETWRAMERNRLIYALADAALVVQSDLHAGGTWAGASKQIRTLRDVPVFVRGAGPPSAGLDGLRELGAGRWPEPADAAGLAATLRGIRAGDGLRAAERVRAAVPSERGPKGAW